MLKHHVHKFIAGVGLSVALVSGANMAQAEVKRYYGRWTVSDDKPVFTSKGKMYKTVDIAPCGSDFCGVSVAEDSSCGPTMFRFFTSHNMDDLLTGHGRWGDVKKKLQLGYIAADGETPKVMIGLGADDFDFEGREGSMPTYQANYKRLGDATCTAK